MLLKLKIRSIFDTIACDLRLYRNYKKMLQVAGKYYESEEYVKSLDLLFRCKFIVEMVISRKASPPVLKLINNNISLVYDAMAKQGLSLFKQISQLYKLNPSETELILASKDIFLALYDAGYYSEASIYGNTLFIHAEMFADDFDLLWKAANCFFFIGDYAAAHNKYERIINFCYFGVGGDELYNAANYPNLINYTAACEKMGCMAEAKAFSFLCSNPPEFSVQNQNRYIFSNSRFSELLARLIVSYTIDAQEETFMCNSQSLAKLEIMSADLSVMHLAELAVLASIAYERQDYFFCIESFNAIYQFYICDTKYDDGTAIAPFDFYLDCYEEYGDMFSAQMEVIETLKQNGQASRLLAHMLDDKQLIEREKLRICYALAFLHQYWLGDTKAAQKFYSRAIGYYESVKDKEYIDYIYGIDALCKAALVNGDFVNHADKAVSEYNNCENAGNILPYELHMSIIKILRLKSTARNSSLSAAIVSALEAAEIIKRNKLAPSLEAGLLFDQLGKYYERIGNNTSAIQYTEMALGCCDYNMIDYDYLSRRLEILTIKVNGHKKAALSEFVTRSKRSSYFVVYREAVTQLYLYKIPLFAPLLNVVITIVLFPLLSFMPLVLELISMIVLCGVKTAIAVSKNTEKKANVVKTALKIGDWYKAAYGFMGHDTENPFVLFAGKTLNRLNLYNDALHMLLLRYSDLSLDFVKSSYNMSRICLLIGDALRAKFNYSQSIESYKRAIMFECGKNSAQTEYVHFSLGEIYFELHAYEYARHEFSFFFIGEQVNGSSKYGSRVMIYMAYMLLESGYNAEARVYLKNAIDNYWFGKQRNREKAMAYMAMFASYADLQLLDYIEDEEQNKKCNQKLDVLSKKFKNKNIKITSKLKATKEYGVTIDVFAAINLLDLDKYRNPKSKEDEKTAEIVRQYVQLICENADDEKVCLTAFALSCYEKARVIVRKDIIHNKEIIDPADISGNQDIWAFWHEAIAQIQEKGGDIKQALDYYADASIECGEYFSLHHFAYLRILYKAIALQLRLLWGNDSSFTQGGTESDELLGANIKEFVYNYEVHIVDNMDYSETELRDMILHSNEHYLDLILYSVISRPAILDFVEIDTLYTFVLRTKYISYESALQIRDCVKRHPEYADRINLYESLLKKTGKNPEEEKLTQRLEREIAAVSFELDYQTYLSNISTRLILSFLKDDEAIIEYKRVKYLDSDFYLAFVLSKGKVSLHKCEDAAYINHCVNELRIKITDVTEVGYESLSNSLIAPLGINFRQLSKVYIAPDDELFKQPFELLSTNDGVSLLEIGVSVSYISTGRSVAREKSSRDYADALVIADPKFNISCSSEAVAASDTRFAGLGSEPIKELPLTVEEANVLIKTIDKTTARLRENATKNALKEEGSKSIVHIATHGFAISEGDGDSRGEVAEDPLRQFGLIFAGAEDVKRGQEFSGEAQLKYGNGILDGIDILSLDLRKTNLLVLSACQTGLGYFDNANGVKGLRYAFEMAGIKVMVCTLWEVDDKASAILMYKFYGNISKGSEPESALAAAKKYMCEFVHSEAAADKHFPISFTDEEIEYYADCKPYAHPYFWAGYILVGK